MKDTNIDVKANQLMGLCMVKMPFAQELAKEAGLDVIFGDPIKVRLGDDEIPIEEWEFSLSNKEFHRLESLVRIKFAETFLLTLEQHLNERYSNEE